jgi:hypothetical protein
MGANFLLRAAPHPLSTVTAMPLLRRRLCAVLFLGLAPLPPHTASATQLTELPSILVIAKSSNKNQVHYAELVDDSCVPAGRSPVHPYWRMLERGPAATEPLLDREQRMLGLARQEIEGDTVQIVVRAMPQRPITIRTWRGPDGGCSSSTEMTIAGVRARLDSVYVRQRLFGIDYILLTGWSKDGAVVRERVSP